MLAVVTGTVVLASACSDGGGTPPPENTAPVAKFDMPPCIINVACNFASTSTDDAQVTGWRWDFNGDDKPDATTASATFTYSTAEAFNVSLTVHDAQGLSDTKTSTITIAPGQTPPTAGFTHSCSAVDCTFTSTSTDVAPGTIVTYAWTFGDGATADVSNPSHRYTVSAPTAFTVTLTVTDNEGANDVATQMVTVAPVVPGNTPPTASFTRTCNAAQCIFTSTSTDVAPGTIAAHAWTFGDGATADVKNPSHTYTVSAPTDFTVTLTVTDNQGATAVATQTVSVAPGVPGNFPPTASFTPFCYGADCIFTSTSTDVAPGTIATYAWTFGDGGTADWNKPDHSYTITARTTFTVTLTVTDNEGATAVATKTITLTPLPPAVEGCTTSGHLVECVLDIAARSTLKLKLLGVNCEDRGQKVTTPPPIGDQVFLRVCRVPVGEERGVFGGRLDELWIFQVGSQARIWFTQGTPSSAFPVLGPPAAQLTGTFPDWTINFEDGYNPGGAGEPDFTDLVVGVHATVR
jgi:PKD repeat protein